MNIKEYFGEWVKVIPLPELKQIITKLYPIRDKICPEYKNIFKAFHECPYRNLKLVVIGQDPYPQQGIATGIAFANHKNTYEENLSPSLQVIKESIINYEIPHNLITFVPDLEDWAHQGVLLLNTALTCEIDKPGSHSLLWRPFIDKLIKNISDWNPGTVFLLLGNSAQSFKNCIGKNQYIFEERHPSYYYRNNTKMPHQLWRDINDVLTKINKYGITFYKEEKYESDLCEHGDW